MEFLLGSIRRSLPESAWECPGDCGQGCFARHRWHDGGHGQGGCRPGNSGGPVFVSNDNKIVGVVVWEMRLLSQTVPTVIDGFKRGGGVRTTGTFSMTLPDGKTRPVTDQEAVALLLEEFYNTVQIMIGEAISVTELRNPVNSLQGWDSSSQHACSNSKGAPGGNRKVVGNVSRLGSHALL